jgi:serine/threonine protein kinase
MREMSVRSAARIHHPGAVTLYDVLPATSSDDAIYLIMEYVEGPTFAGLIRRSGPLPAGAVAAHGLQLLSVLDATHALASCTVMSSRPTSSSLRAARPS